MGEGEGRGGGGGEYLATAGDKVEQYWRSLAISINISSFNSIRVLLPLVSTQYDTT